MHCKDQNPIDWLKENWQTTISSVQTLATQMGRECPMNIVGTVSEREAKEALIQHKGNMWPAVEECVRQRQKKVGSENTPDVKLIWRAEMLVIELLCVKSHNRIS